MVVRCRSRCARPTVRSYEWPSSMDGRWAGTLSKLFKTWRRDRDSNPGYPFEYTRFPSVRLQPLGHLSVGKKRLAVTPEPRRCLIVTYCKGQEIRRYQ